jgi:LytS/YehU family sensor histidine kinase
LDGLRRLCAECRGEGDYIESASSAIAGFFGTEVVKADNRIDAALREKNLLYPVLASHLNLTLPGVDLIVPLRITPEDVRHILLGPRRGGRRYLSEDLATLARLSAQVLEHIEHFRTAEMRRLVAQAELRALESQIHPHFLFNALNTLYGTIPREAAAARRVVLSLADILRYCLQPDRTFIRLGEELAIIRSYLEIEKLRLGDRLRVELDIAPGSEDILIPLLTLEPLVENAIKHGISHLAEGGLVRVEAALAGDLLQIRVSDTGRGFQPATGKAPVGEGGAGVGLANVEKRLQLCYGQDAAFTIRSSGGGTCVEFSVPIHQQAGVTA